MRSASMVTPWRTHVMRPPLLRSGWNVQEMPFHHPRPPGGQVCYWARCGLGVRMDIRDSIFEYSVDCPTSAKQRLLYMIRAQPAICQREHRLECSTGSLLVLSTSQIIPLN